MALKIGELARRCGCQAVTVRFYEKEGLLPEPERGQGNYRLYSEADVEKLKFIRACRQHGMSIPEIHELVSFSEHPGSSCSWINSLIEKHIAEVDRQMADLGHLKQHLEDLLHGCAGDRGGSCGILKLLKEGGNCEQCRGRLVSNCINNTNNFY